MKESSLELRATPEDVMRGVTHLEEFFRAEQVPQSAIHALMLGVEEMASNIVNHAYRRDADRTFQLKLRHCAGQLEVELRDQGPPFDPLQAPPPDLTIDPDERPEGGLGIHLVRKFIPDIRYSREGDDNVLRMRMVP